MKTVSDSSQRAVIYENRTILKLSLLPYIVAHKDFNDLAPNFASIVPPLSASKHRCKLGAITDYRGLCMQEVKPWDYLGLFYGMLMGLLSLAGQPALAQQTELPEAPEPQTQHAQPEPKKKGTSGEYGKHHILWVIPNYREDESQEEFKPLTGGEKFKVAFDDSFDPTAFLVAGVFAGSAMAQREYPQFGHGFGAVSKYYGGAFADQSIANMLTEAALPIVLHQDPRYFTKGNGGFFKRTAYALSREVVTKNDAGRNTFNTSEILGNGIAAGISNLYYPAADRSFGNTANKWGQQIGLDAGFNIMKEFWPDIRHKILNK